MAKRSSLFYQLRADADGLGFAVCSAELVRRELNTNLVRLHRGKAMRRELKLPGKGAVKGERIMRLRQRARERESAV